MKKRVILPMILLLGAFSVTSFDAHAQSRRKPSQAQPKISGKTSAKAVTQFRTVRNKLANAEKASLKSHAQAQSTLIQAMTVERQLKDKYADARAAALSRAPRNTDLSPSDFAQRDPAVRQAVRQLQTATARRANAEMSVNQSRLNYIEARRQTKAANHTLSLAKKGDWVQAHRTVGQKNPRPPAPRVRKITFRATPLGATPRGNNRNVKTGILKASTRSR